jgi:8-oxo-dGTP diphosphatase
MSDPVTQREVSAAVVLSGGRVLVQTRAGAGRYQGYWEFPGGGREVGESVEDCVRRECLEELGLEVQVLEALHEQCWSYPGAQVRVVFLLCAPAREAQQARPLEGQQMRWVEASELPDLKFLPANARVLELVAQRLAQPDG